MKKTLAVVVTYNRLDLLKKVIAALEAQTACCDILLVNNASTDGTEDWAEAHSASLSEGAAFRFFYENTGANLGGAGGFNYGMRRSVEMGYDLAWIMDDDAIPQKDALEMLLAADTALFEKANVSSADVPVYGFLSSVVRWKDGSLCRMNLQRFSDHYLQEEDLAALRENELPQVECATFVSLLIPKQIMIQYGLPIKEFFIWSDDIEYTSRLTVRNKIPAYLVPKSVVIHETKVNESSNIVTDDYERLDRYRYAIRNGNYAHRHYSAKRYLVYLLDLARSLVLVLFRSKDHKLKRSRIILSSFFQGLFFNPEIEYVKAPEQQ